MTEPLECTRCGRPSSVLDAVGRCTGCLGRVPVVTKLEREQIAMANLYELAKSTLGPNHAATNLLGAWLVEAANLAEIDRAVEEQDDPPPWA